MSGAAVLSSASVAELARDYEQTRCGGDGARQRVAGRRLGKVVARGDYRQAGSPAHRLLAELRARDWAAQCRPDLLAAWLEAARPDTPGGGDPRAPSRRE